MNELYDGDKFSDANFYNPENEILLNLTKDNLDKLMEIILGAARIIVNIRNDDSPKKIFKIEDNEIDFKSGSQLCQNPYDNHFGPFTAIFPEEKNKNKFIYDKLFNENNNDIKEEDIVKFSGYKYGEILPQKLMSTLNNGKSVVIFGFGFSGSGKTYTLIEGDKNKKPREDKSLLEQFIENNGDNIDSVEFLEIYPENNTIYTGNDDLSKKNLKTILKPTAVANTYDTISQNYLEAYNSINNNISSEEIITKINKINELRIKKLRILPTPNNPESSRSFLQITIKLKRKEDGTGGGQLVLFDMPGTENTVNIKKIMLGEKIFIDISQNEGKEVTIETLREKNNDIKTKDPELVKDISKYFNRNKKSYLCHILFNNNKKEYCELANQYVAMEEELLKNLDGNFIIHYNEIYKDYYNNISKIIFLKTSETLKNQFNIIFKYFILNIYGFELTGINFYMIAGHDPKVNVGLDIKKITDEKIANIGVEIALFFNGKAGKTIKDINKDDEIFFLKDEDFKKIYDNFINTYIFKKNGDKTIFINTETGYSLKDKLSDEDLKLIANIFSICNEYNDKDHLTKKIYEPYNVTAFFSKLFGESNINSEFFKTLNINKDTKVINPLIKYILFIFEYLYVGSKLSNLQCEPLVKLQEQLNAILVNYEAAKKEKEKKIKKEIKVVHDITEFLNEYFEKNNDKSNTFKNSLLEKFKKDYEQYEKVNKFYRASVYFIYKYIKFIVNQGSAIVTTLEHLKFFFLTSANQIENYNKQALSNKDTEGKSFTINNPSNKMSSILTSDQTYVIPTEITKVGGKPIIIAEEINIGNMNRYGLLPILQHLAGNQTDIFQLNMKKLTGKEYYTPDLLTQPPQPPQVEGQPSISKLKSIFVMLAHINTTTTGKEEKLVCEAVKDTLIYINSISIVQPIKPHVGGYNKNKFNMKALLNKQNKVDIKTKNQRRISMKNISKKKRLFSSKTKKNKH